jgi:phosphoadenosine phosphosulfate reductase
MGNVKEKRPAGKSLTEKIRQAKKVVADALRSYGQSLGICWTGGKDSTLLLWLVREVCLEQASSIPQCILIDDGDTFPEIKAFIENIRDRWTLPLLTIRNNDVLRWVQDIGDLVRVSELSNNNRKALEEIGFVEEEFPFEPESLVGNHLMKTVPLKECVVQGNLQAIFVALRRDEHEARYDEELISPRENPEHVRIHPILEFSERDVWHAIMANNVPYCELYGKGYRSLGSRYNTEVVSPEVPAWEQDLENTPERLGRGRYKEQIMARLRSLGYM